MLRVEHLLLTNNSRISFEVADSKCLAVHGPSGAGKSRLLRAIADLDENPGQVFLDGAERNEMTAPEWRKQVRYVAAEPGWSTDTPRPAFPTGKQKMVKLVKLLRDLNIDIELLDRPISRLSTGERQRLAIARAMIDSPHVLLLDEPTAALDKANTALVEELIKYQLLSEKIVVLVSHDTAQVKRLSATTLELEAVPSRTSRQGALAKRRVHQ